MNPFFERIFQVIPFNSVPVTGAELDYIADALSRGSASGDGVYSRKCQNWFVKELRCADALLTPSCTHSLEMAALLLEISPGDEVIMPSYTFVSTANAFVLRGAQIVFVDIRPDTMNIDERLIEQAISPRTKAVVPVHYAGVACEMDEICELANANGIAVVEDAAQAFMSRYKGAPLGSMGDIGAFSFHETKNISSGGEGGLTIINSSRLVERANYIRDKGTNRKQFFRGQVDKYTWTDIGSSYLMNDISAAYLWAQLENCEKILQRRLQLYNRYRDELSGLAAAECIQLPSVPLGIEHNGHMFYIKVNDLKQRDGLIKFLREQDIYAPFHYVPLHSSPMGKEHCRFSGRDRYTTIESERLIRLPLFFNMSDQQQDKVIEVVSDYFKMES